MSLSGLPFDDIRQLLADLPECDAPAVKRAQRRNKDLAARFGSLGDQAGHIEWFAGWSGKDPVVLRPMIALFAGTHGVANGAGGQLGEPTLETVTRLAAGGSPVNQICAANDIGLKVFDLALPYPVADIRLADALSEKDCAATIGFGMEAIAGGVDLLGIGAFGQGSCIANAAILMLLRGNDSDWPKTLNADVGEMARQAAQKHRAATGNCLEILRRLGGREHAAVAGAIIAARMSRIPVILDGMSAATVVAILENEKAGACAHCMIACRSSDFINSAGLSAVLPQAGELVDASAAGLAISQLKSSAAVHANTRISVD